MAFDITDIHIHGDLGAGNIFDGNNNRWGGNISYSCTLVSERRAAQKLSLSGDSVGADEYKRRLEEILRPALRTCFEIAIARTDDFEIEEIVKFVFHDRLMELGFILDALTINSFTRMDGIC